MAGGKETPRQKMIGMMYMVLTALLALNVSSAIIEKFVIIDDTLVKLEHAADSSNAVLATAIQRGTSAGASVDTAKRKALQVRELTKNTLNFLDIVKKTMALKVPPADPPRFLKPGEVLKGPDGKDVGELEGEDYNLNSHRPEEFFLGDAAQKTVGAEFEGTLNKYVKQMNDYITQVNATKPTTSDGKLFVIPGVKKLTRTITDFPEFKEEADKESTHKDFLEFSFQNVPLPAAMAYISELQAEILENEKVTLGGLKTIASAAEYVVDQLVPMVTPESNTVILGLYYEADMFLAGSPSAGAVPEMFAGAAKLEVSKKDVGSGVLINRGKVKIKATANNFVDNVAKQSFVAKIVIPGRAKPAELPIDFKVLRPTAKIGTVSGLSLYKDCGNIIEVSIPGMTDMSILGLSLPADEGRVTRISPGKFQVVPSRNSCTLAVTLEGSQIQSEKARPQDVPPPVLILKQGGREVENPSSGPLNLEPEITDKVFTSDAYKDDNRLIIQSFSYSINGGSTTVVNSGNINLTSIGARKGDNIQFSKFNVVRKDYTGALKPVNSTRMSKGFRIQ